MSSVAAKVTNLIFRMMPSDKPGQPHDYQAERRRNESRKPPRLPKNVHLQETVINGFPAEILTKEGNKKGWVLYVHGGGFTTGSARERRMVTQYITDKYGYDCVAVNYRLSPENKWPVQIEDCEACYREILEMGYDPEKAVFMGESAGGTLVLALALLARDKGLPLPKAVVSHSPATDNSRQLPSHISKISTDYMLRDAVSKGITDVMFDHMATEEELRNPLLSPYYGDYSGLPPIFLSVSDSETLYDDTMILYDKLVSEKHPCGLDVQHDVCHAYAIMPYMPEARRTLDKCFRFIENLPQ